MTMKVLKLYLHCSTDEALTLIEFIDQIRDVVVEHYGEDIVQAAQQELEEQSEQITLPVDDPIDF